MKRTATFLLALALAAPAAATTLLKLTLDELTQRSDAVVRGTVKKVESRWSGDGHRIFTAVDVEVAEALKGSVAKTVRIVQPGGSVGDIAQTVSGLASFAPDEEVVLFLERRGTQTFAVSGMAQGKFRVQRSSDGRAAFAVPDSLGDAVLIDPLTRQPAPSALKTMDLGDLARQVKRAARARTSP